ncbi:Synaptogenesis protein syg-2 [Holothuria leucospilota]|uniref:Synaptogenesis protein syg-2 n=1 Tax=Holothuria leucospilota TaxID=206669 RepID=A0A9Q1BZ25_HOLLE|nr:Synaptogenesis protein syg-2 [Holothuria leucospilota]
MLKLIFHSVFIVGVSSRVALFGKPAELCCSLNDSRTAQFITWMKDDSVISTSKYNANLLSYKITNTTYKDAGIYKCILDYQSGLSNEQQFLLQVHDYPEYYSNTSTSMKNSTIFALCCVNYSPFFSEPGITWLIGIDTLTTSHEKYRGKSHHSEANSVCSMISFQSSGQHHKKKLVCLVADELSVNESMELNVTYPASIISLQITSSDESYPDQIWENQTAFIDCEADGNPTPLVLLESKHMNKIGWQTSSYDFVTKVDSHNRYHWKFVLPNVTRNESGEYRCTATNAVAQYYKSKSGYLDVKYPAAVEMVTKSTVNIEWGASYTVVCVTDSNPLSKVTLHTIVQGHWIELPTQPSNIATNGYISKWEFQLRNVSDGFKGKYRCVASNRPGKVAVSDILSVNVLAKPLPNSIAMKHGHLVIVSISVIFVLATVIISTWIYFSRKRTSFDIIRRRPRMITSYRRNRFPDLIRTSQVFQGATCSTFQKPFPNQPENKDKYQAQHQRQKDFFSMPPSFCESDLSDVTCDTSENTSKGKRGSNCDSYGYAYVHELEIDLKNVAI